MTDDVPKRQTLVRLTYRDADGKPVGSISGAVPVELTGDEEIVIETWPLDRHPGFLAGPWSELIRRELEDWHAEE